MYRQKAVMQIVNGAFGSRQERREGETDLSAPFDRAFKRVTLCT